MNKQKKSGKRRYRRRNNNRLPIPFKEGSQLFSPGKTTLLLHKDERFNSEITDMSLNEVITDNNYELTWALSAYSYYKIVKVQIIVFPNHSRSKCNIMFSWYPITFDNGGQFIQSDNVKMVLFPKYRPSVFTYYPINAVINTSDNTKDTALNYKDWISTDNTTFPGVVWYINDGGIDEFRIQVLLKFRGARAPLLNTLISNLQNIKNQEEKKKDKEEGKKIDKNKKKEEKENEEEDHWYSDVSEEEEVKEEEVKINNKNKNKTKKKALVEKDDSRPKNNVKV